MTNDELAESEEVMKRSLLHSWVGVGLLGLLAAAGCRHAHRSCDCCWDCGTVQSVVVLPTTPATAAEVTSVAAQAPAPAPTTKPTPPTDDPQIRRAAHKVEPAREVLATVVTPDATNIGGATAGTMSLTTPEAEGRGIRPGYTPGALYAPGSNPN
jgi:hypothetical protein